MMKTLLEKDANTKSTVSFNFPKYQAKGTPHDIWLENVQFVEEFLENIIKNQPYIDEYPLLHLRREDKNSEGLITNVHFDLYGKATMVRFAMEMLDSAVRKYVSANIFFSDGMIEGLKKFLQDVSSETILQDSNLINSLGKYLYHKNMSIEDLGEISSELKAKVQDVFNNLTNGIKEEKEDLEEKEQKEDKAIDNSILKTFVMPNPSSDPDDFN